MGLPTVKIGRSVRFRLDSVIKWLSELEESNSSQTVSVYSNTDNSHLL